MNSFDVIVVGAGPSGATTARRLAQRGVKTLLLEKEKLPRYKPCGGGVTAKVKPLLDFDFSPTVEDTIDTASVAYLDQIRVPVKFRGVVGWSVMRDRFDALLTEQAVKAGAELRDQTPVQKVEIDQDGVSVKTGKAELRAQAIVGADGANGLVARAAGLHTGRRIVAALEAEVDVPSAAIDAWRGVWHLDFGAIQWGYGWIFPKAEHLSVGVGTWVNSTPRLNLRAILNRYLSSEPTLREIKHIALHGHLLPLGGIERRLHAPRVLLVGDAASVIDPFSGEGIYAGIKSGIIAAEELSRGLAASDLTFANYSARIVSEFTDDYKWGWVLSKIFYRKPKPFLRLFAQAMALQDDSEAIVGGRTDYRTTVLKSLKAAPKFLLHKAIARSRNRMREPFA